MRTCAEVCEIVLLIECYVFTFVGVLLCKLYLVGLVHFLKLFNGIFGRKLKAFKLNTRLNNLLHFSLDFFKVIGRKRLFYVKVVVKSVVNCRSDCALCIRIKSFYSLCKHVGSCVPESLFALGVVKCEKLKLAVACKLSAQVYNLSVNFCAAD